MGLLRTLPAYQPTALKWLQDENHLKADASPDSYTWLVYSHDVENKGIEEVLYTSTCASWAQGGTIRRVFKYNDPQDKISQALLTWFPIDRAPHEKRGGCAGESHARVRALVVLMDRRAHVYLSNGPSSTINLPFEVEKAFASPKGLVLQRRVTRPQTATASPRIPDAPPNSFRSSQIPQWTPSDWEVPSRNSLKDRDHLTLTDFATLPIIPKADDLPRLFTLSDPLAEVGLVTDASTRGTSSTLSGSRVDRGTLPLSEHDEILYLSSHDELDFDSEEQLILVLTLDRSRSLYRLWRATYIETPPIASVRKAKKDGVDASARMKRRSSFNPRSSAGSAPGTPLPRVNKLRQKRESGATRASLLGLPPQEVDIEDNDLGDFSHFEETFGSVLRPESKSNRRASSMMARAELSSQEQHSINDVVRNPSGNHGSFRAQSGATASFGGYGNRDSFGRSRLSGRYSASASMLRLTETEELTTIDSAGDSTLLDFLSLEDNPGGHDLASSGLKKELHLAHIASIPTAEKLRPGQFALLKPSSDTEFFTTSSPWRRTPTHGRSKTINLFAMFHGQKTLCEITCRVSDTFAAFAQRSDLAQSGLGRYQVMRDELHIQEHTDIDTALALKQHGSGRLLTSRSAILRLDAFPSLDPHGQARFLLIPSTRIHDKLGPLGGGRFCALQHDLDFTQWQLHTKPENHSISTALQTLQAALDLVHPHIPSLGDIWLSRLHTLDSNCQEAEWQALAESIIFVVLSTFKSSDIEVAPLIDISNEQPTVKGIYASSAWGWATLKAKSISQRELHCPRQQLDIQKIAFQWQSEDVSVKDKGLHDALNLAFLGFDTRVAQSFRAGRIVLALLGALHIWSEEQLLHVTTSRRTIEHILDLAYVLCQWALWSTWSKGVPNPQQASQIRSLKTLQPDWKARSLQDALDSISSGVEVDDLPLFEKVYEHQPREDGFPVVAEALLQRIYRDTRANTRRVRCVLDFTKTCRAKENDPAAIVEVLEQMNMAQAELETFPEGIGSKLKTVLKQAQMNCPDIMSKKMAHLLDRADVETSQSNKLLPLMSELVLDTPDSSRDFSKVCIDVRAISESVNKANPALRSANEEAAVSMRLIYRDDRRWHEAAKILNPLRVAITTIFPKPDSTESQFLEDQKALAELVYKRTMAIPSGQAALNFNSHRPLLTEKIEVKPFNTTCNMQPSNNIVNADKSNFTEEKVSWAFFHAGVNAGLRIAANSPKVDNSWLILNKPNELGNRHAGFLYALGLNGHLKSMAKWLAFKYLTPKHNMTSIGLLLGLSASHMGTMDSLVTRLLSVHVTRLLPPGAAELNLSPLTQTAGVLGVGLLYYGSQHRRMSEIMLSEIENLTGEDSNDSPSSFRDEGYRLAAGLALGLINLGKGRHLQNLHDLRVVERLLSVAIGSRTVDTVHVLDQSSAGAVMAYALIFMKSENKRLASEIGISRATTQFDYVRPDALLLRTVASNLIMWKEIEPSLTWMLSKLPAALLSRRVNRFEGLLDSKRPLDSSKIPLYNIMAGLCWSIALRCAGGAHRGVEALELLVQLFDKIKSILGIDESQDLNWDELLARDSLLRFQHVLALSMATVAAGTGNLTIFRRLRYLHAAINSEQTFGLHQASHIAMGILFLGHGKYTFNTSDLAIASLLCAFYPLFPKDVLDNRAHLQAMRHLWVYASEPRCLLPMDIETKEIVNVPVTVRLKSGSEIKLIAPGLLPDLDSISEVCTDSTEWWNIKLNFERNGDHLAAFKRHQTILLRRKGLLDQPASTLSADLAAQQIPFGLRDMRWIFNLSQLVALGVNRAHTADLLHVPHGEDAYSVLRKANRAPLIKSILDRRTSAIDGVLCLHKDVHSDDAVRLKALRSLLSTLSSSDGATDSIWLRLEWLEALRLAVIHRITAEEDQLDGRLVEEDVVMSD